MAFETLQELVDELAQLGDRTAVITIDGERSTLTTYTELTEKSTQLAVGLLQERISSGDRVGIIAANSAEWIIAALGIAHSGAVVVPLDPQMPQETFDIVLQDSGVRLLFAGSDEISRLKMPERVPVYQLDNVSGNETHAESKAYKSWTSLFSPDDIDFPQVNESDLVALFYTSGTTGPPKGVPITHANICWVLNRVIEMHLAKRSDRVLVPLPLYHVYPFVVSMLYSLSQGLVMVMPLALTGPVLAKIIKAEKVTVIFGVPKLYKALYDAIERRAQERGADSILHAMQAVSATARKRLRVNAGRLLFRSVRRQVGPNLRLLATGGALIDEALATKLRSLGWEIAIGYGLTETAALVSVNPPGGNLQSVGKPLPGVEVRIDPVPDISAQNGEQQGEIVVRGPNIFSGYWNLEEKTKEAFTEDGWFRTGDLGYIKDGEIIVTGRVSTVIVTSAGKNIQPDELEQVYMSNPVIEHMGVFQRDGELAAVVYPNLTAIREAGAENIDTAVREAIEAAARQLPTYKRVSRYAVSRDPLPQTRLGKVRRHMLEESFQKALQAGAEERRGAPIPIEEMSLDDQELLENEAARKVWDLLCRNYPDEPLTPGTSPQLDLGVDSMEWLTLSLDISQHSGVELDDEALNRIETIRDLLNEVAKAETREEAIDPDRIFQEPEAYVPDEHKKWLKPLGPLELVLARFFYLLNRAIMRSLFRLEVEGLDRLPDKKTQLVFAPNHASYLDACVLAAALQFSRLRRTQWATAVAVVRFNAFVRFMCRLAQSVPVDPDRAIMSSLATGAAVLKAGRNLVWFPEQRRTETGELQPFKPGISMLIEHFNVQVVPVYISGTFEALPPGRFLPRLKQVTVRFGEPVKPATLERQGRGKQRHKKMASALQDRVRDLKRAA